MAGGERVELPTTQERPDRCETCRFWHGCGPCPEIVEPKDWPVGECRRKAPGAYAVARMEPVAGTEFVREVTRQVPFPPMLAQGWCGEWQVMSFPMPNPDDVREADEQFEQNGGRGVPLRDAILRAKSLPPTSP